MIDLKIQYINNQGIVIEETKYTSPTLFLEELNNLTTLNKTLEIYRASFVNDELFSFNCSDDLIVELDANILKKYKILQDSFPSDIVKDPKQFLTLSLDIKNISEYCQKYSKKFFELSGVVGIKDKVKNKYYDSDSKDFSSTSFLYLTQSFNKVYSICSETKISKIFMNMKDLEYVDVLLHSNNGFVSKYSYLVVHEGKFKEAYANLIKV